MRLLSLFLLIVCFSSLKVYSQRRQERFKFNIDIYGGIGRHGFYGPEVEGDKAPYNLFYNVRSRYKFYKKYEIEAGIGQSQFASFYHFGGFMEIEKTYNLPILIRIPLKKNILLGIGAEYNMLNNAYTYDGEIEEDNSELYNKNFWGPS